MTLRKVHLHPDFLPLTTCLTWDRCFASWTLVSFPIKWEYYCQALPLKVLVMDEWCLGLDWPSARAWAVLSKGGLLALVPPSRPHRPLGWVRPTCWVTSQAGCLWLLADRFLLWTLQSPERDPSNFIIWQMTKSDSRWWVILLEFSHCSHLCVKGRMHTHPSR